MTGSELICNTNSYPILLDCFVLCFLTLQLRLCQATRRDVRDVRMGREKEKKSRTNEVGVKTGHVRCRMCLHTANSPPEQGGGDELTLYITAVTVLWCGCSSPCPITDSNSIYYRGT